jgi:hypothetical protein
MKHKAWRIQAAGRVFSMIDPEGCTEAQALAEVKARWPDAKIVKNTHGSRTASPGIQRKEAVF